MRKDYANKQAATPMDKTAKDDNRPRWLWLTCLLAVICFVAGLAFLRLQHYQQLHPSGAPVENHEQQAIRLLDLDKHENIVAKTPPPTAKKIVNKPKFDFYDVLPEDGPRPLKPTQAASKAAPVVQAEKKVVLPKPLQHHKEVVKHKVTGRYYIQLASFLSATDADNFKGRLLLDSYQPTIKRSKMKGQTWYRVIIGPYSSLTKAKHDNKKLRSHGVNGFISKKKS